MRELAERYSDGEVSWLDGVSVDYGDLALQRAALEHRAAPAPQPRGVHPGGDGGADRGGPAHHPRVTASRSTAEAALERAAEAGIHTLRIPTPFAVGRVNTYLIEDDPLTLVDSGPNSGRRSTSSSTSSPSTATRSTTSS